eukprot:ANDGO_03549.mRNA.1 Dolichol kinase EVAN
MGMVTALWIESATVFVVLAACFVGHSENVWIFPGLMLATVYCHALDTSYVPRSSGLRTATRGGASHGFVVAGLCVPCVYLAMYLQSAARIRSIAWTNFCLTSLEFTTFLILVPRKRSLVTSSLAIAGVLFAVSVVLGFLLFHFRIVPFAVSLVSFYWLFNALLEKHARNFSVGELVIVCQLISIVCGDFTILVVSKWIGPILSPYLLGSVTARCFLVAAVLGVPFSALVAKSVVRVSGNRQSLGLYAAAFVTVLAGIVLSWMAWILNTHPVRYVLLRFVSIPDVPFLVLYWGAMGGVCVAAAYFLRSAIPLILVRKLFHFLSLLLFIPGFFVDVNFMSISFSSALGLFLLIECTPEELIQPLRLFMRAFIDERDSSGRLVLTHIYLLFGCACSVFLHGDNRGNRLVLYGGLISLGVGDTCACLVGKLAGRRRLFGSSKTAEGLLANVISCIIAYSLLWIWTSDLMSTSRLLIACVSLGMLEAAVPHLDNLVLPLFAHLLLTMATL